MAIQLSARNQLKAKVKSVKLGTVMAEVVVELSDGQQIVSAITRTSAEGLGLKEGDDIVAIIKSTEVMIGKNVRRVSTSNPWSIELPRRVQQTRREGATMATVVLLGTLDTKGIEYEYLRRQVQAFGCEVILSMLAAREHL